MLKNFFLSEKKLQMQFKSKAQAHEKCFFLMKWTVFAMQKTDFHEFELFLQEKVILELKCTKSLL